MANFESIFPLITPTKKQLELLKKLYDKFCPAPLTFILPKSDIVPKYITGGRETVAVRVPNCKITLDFLKASKCPIPAPSANISGTPSPTKFEHVAADLDGKIDAILKGD
ncbi:L-threonylcarbamoyladenylate synthase, partial [Treponema sp. R6D11]